MTDESGKGWLVIDYAAPKLQGLNWSRKTDKQILETLECPLKTWKVTTHINVKCDGLQTTCSDESLIVWPELMTSYRTSSDLKQWCSVKDDSLGKFNAYAIPFCVSLREMLLRDRVSKAGNSISNRSADNFKIWFAKNLGSPQSQRNLPRTNWQGPVEVPWDVPNCSSKRAAESIEFFGWLWTSLWDVLKGAESWKVCWIFAVRIDGASASCYGRYRFDRSLLVRDVVSIAKNLEWDTCAHPPAIDFQLAMLLRYLTMMYGMLG